MADSNTKDGIATSHPLKQTNRKRSRKTQNQEQVLPRTGLPTFKDSRVESQPYHTAVYPGALDYGFSREFCSLQFSKAFQGFVRDCSLGHGGLGRVVLGLSGRFVHSVGLHA